jgi:hypothetical protein
MSNLLVPNNLVTQHSSDSSDHRPSGLLGSLPAILVDLQPGMRDPVCDPKMGCSVGRGQEPPSSLSQVRKVPKGRFPAKFLHFFLFFLIFSGVCDTLQVIFTNEVLCLC